MCSQKCQSFSSAGSQAFKQNMSPPLQKPMSEASALISLGEYLDTFKAKQKHGEITLT